jgi:hypothetical protein
MNKGQMNGGVHLLLSMKLPTASDRHRIGYQSQNNHGAARVVVAEGGQCLRDSE